MKMWDYGEREKSHREREGKREENENNQYERKKISRELCEIFLDSIAGEVFLFLFNEKWVLKAMKETVDEGIRKFMEIIWLRSNELKNLCDKFFQCYFRCEEKKREENWRNF